MADAHEHGPIFDLARPRGGEGAAGSASDILKLPDAIDDPESLEAYLSDASGLRGRASALVRPRDEAGIAAALRWASATRTPVTVSAARTSTTGASVPEGGLVLSMERLDRVLEIDVARGFARAEPGVVLGDFQRAIEAAGGFYPPDPTSRDECTLGGSVACNASGSRSFLYGATRGWVRALRVVLVDGSVLELARGGQRGDGFRLRFPDGRVESIAWPRGGPPHPAKHAAGYPLDIEAEPIDLFIGSEGTLGVISEIEVTVRPRPARVLAILAGFPDRAAAVALVRAGQGMRRDLNRRGPRDPRALVPRCLEYFDGASLDLVRAIDAPMRMAPCVGAAVYLEQECVDEAHEAVAVEAWADELARAGASMGVEDGVQVATTEAQRRALQIARHAVPSAINARAAARGMPKLGTDLAVGDEKLEAVLALYEEAMRTPVTFLGYDERERLAREIGAGRSLPTKLEAYAFGHIGDNHLHVNFLPVDEVELALARAVYAALTRRVVALGGTPSAEHGIGKTKRDAFAEWLGAKGLSTLRGIKQALDPDWILGRGNLLVP